MTLPRLRAKLIFNPLARSAGQSPQLLLDVVRALQAWSIVPEVYVVEAGGDRDGVVADALARGVRVFVVCGGDGTIDAAAAALAARPHLRATLGVVPLGTRNNVAFSLGIPPDIPEAVALLRAGRRIKVDLGRATCGGQTFHFLEACSVGLISALFPAADDIQHGNLARVGDFLATLVTSPAAEMRLVFDDRVETAALSHAVLVANMPYIGPRYRVSPAAAPDDGLLDVLVFADLSKLDLLGYAVQEVVGGGAADPRIQYRRVRKLAIETEPAMPILADGVALGAGPLRIEVRPRALAIMAGPAPAAPSAMLRGAAAAEPLAETRPAASGEAAAEVSGGGEGMASWVVSSSQAARRAA